MNTIAIILKKGGLLKNIYNKEMDSIANSNNGVYKLDEDTQREVCNKAFNLICKESTINLSYRECCAIFDLIDRGN